MCSYVYGTFLTNVQPECSLVLLCGFLLYRKSDFLPPPHPPSTTEKRAAVSDFMDTNPNVTDLLTLNLYHSLDI